MSFPAPRSSSDEPDQARGNRSGNRAHQNPPSTKPSPSLPTESDEADQARGNRARNQAHRKSSSTGSLPPPPFDPDETDQARGNRSGTQFRRVRPGKQEDSASTIPPVSALQKGSTAPTSEPTSENISAPPFGFECRPTSSTLSDSESPSKAQLPLESTQPFEFSTNGYTTYEIPLRPKKEELRDDAEVVDAGEKGGGLGQEGLKLRLELNLDMDIELKASIHGDIVLAVL
ncbi:hypothetical protein MMC17_004876 [Xylographa soralifera]|nr:hypothetical protein [Xylographa soralifera]